MRKFIVVAFLLTFASPAFAYNEGLDGPAAGTHGTSPAPSNTQGSNNDGGFWSTVSKLIKGAAQGPQIPRTINGKPNPAHPENQKSKMQQFEDRYNPSRE